MTAIAAFKLTAPASVTAAPFAFAHGFRKGDVPSGRYLVTDVANSVVKPLCYWNDGSVKHAQVMGRANVSTTPLLVSISSTSTAPAAGTPLTAADLAASGAAVSVAVTGVGTVNLSALLASPIRTHISTKEMVECHYAAPVGSDPHLYVLIYSRLYANGQREHDVVLGNGHLGANPAQRDIAVTVTIEGVSAFTSSAYHLSAWAQFDAHGWSGTDPQITPQHDTGYLVRTNLVPNYLKWGAPTSNQLTYLNSIKTYVPGANLGHSDVMGGTGYQDGIGLLPRWDAMYIATLGCKEAFDAVIANARAINSYAVSFAEASNHGPIKITDYPTWSVYGAGQGGSYGFSAIKQDNVNSIAWEKAHHSQGGYLAYLLSGRMRFFDSLQNQARTVFLMEDINGGTGTNRIFRCQNRARGWGYRTMSQAAAVIPDSLLTRYGDIKAWVAGMSAANITRYASLTPFQKSLGFEDFYLNRGTPAPDGESVTGVGMFEFYFVAQAMGHAALMEPCDASGMTSVAAFADFVMGAAVWPLGVSQAGSTDHPFPYASSYQHNIPSDGGSLASGITATNYGQIYTATFSTAPGSLLYNAGGNALLGNSGGDPTIASGYWGNLLPGIAPAVTLGKTGAASAFARLTGASNWASQLNAGYDEVPQFGIVPASYAQQPIQFTPVDSGSGAIVTTPGPSLILDSTPLLGAGTLVLGPYQGHGIPLSAIVAGGSDGTSPIYDAIQAAGGTVSNLSEIRLVVGAGTHGIYVPDETGGGVYTGDGSSDTVNVDYFLDGAQINSAPMYFGTAPSDTTGPTMSGSITASAITSSSFTLSWPAASDNVAVTGYEVSIDGGSNYVNVGNVLTTNKTGLTASTGYATRVRAYDAANNKATPLSAAVATIAGGSTPSIVVNVSPASIGVIVGSSQQFAATLTGPSGVSQAVTWTVSGAASISSSGLATGPIGVYTVTARSIQDNTKAGTALFAVLAPGSASLAPDIGLNTLIVQSAVGIAPFIG